MSPSLEDEELVPGLSRFFCKNNTEVLIGGR